MEVSSSRVDCNEEVVLVQGDDGGASVVLILNAIGNDNVLI